MSFFLIVQLLEAMKGKANVVECTFIKSDITEAPYFANPVLLGKNGIEQNLGMGELSEFEKKKLEEVFDVEGGRVGETKALYYIGM